MMAKVDPSDIGKHPDMIKVAQSELANMDVHVCGQCHEVFHFIEQFQEHKDSQCDLKKRLKSEDKPKVWAFLLWKASQQGKEKENKSSVNAWKIYQNWVNLDEATRETWIVAGKTIQSFARTGQGTLQETPVKITKTVIDNSCDTSPIPEAKKLGGKTVTQLIQRGIDVRPVVRPVKKEDNNVVTNQRISVRPPPLAKIQPQTVSPKPPSRIAKRSIPNSSITEERNVEKILAKRYNSRRQTHEYLIKWVGLSQEANAWEPKSHLDTCPDILETFEKLLAKQKENKARLEQQQQQPATTKAAPTPSPAKPVVTSTPNSVSTRPVRDSKIRAVSQVQQWIKTEHDSNTSKRKQEDSDFDPSFDTEEDDETTRSNKKLKTSEGSNTSTQTMLKNAQANNVQISQRVVRPAAPQTNGPSTQVRRSPIKKATSAEIIITNSRDSKQTGIMKKPGISVQPATKNEATIRVVQKGDSQTSGIMRIFSKSTPQKQQPQLIQRPAGNIIHKTGHTIIRQVPQSQGQGTQIRQQLVQRGNQIVRQVIRTPLTAPPKTVLAKQASTALTRASVSPQVTTSRPQITRIIRSAPGSKANTPEVKQIISKPAAQKIITAKSELLAATKSVENKKNKSVEIESSPKDEDDPMGSSESTLCPVTGKVLGQTDGESSTTESISSNKEKDDNNDPMDTTQNESADNSKSDVKSDDQNNEESAEASINQMLYNEDGAPILVTGEDGTIYQVAGRNEQGQTVLIAQGVDGEQQCVFVAAEGGEGNDEAVLSIESGTTVSAPMQDEEDIEDSIPTSHITVKDGSKEDKDDNNETQPLSVVTEGSGESQDGQITAEVVQAGPPSPGGTRKVVLLLPDNTYMMTEVSEDQYQALNLNS